MLTPDELAAIPIFSTLSPAALEDVARAAADIHLNAGEYAVYEGEPAALFVVIEGTIEVVKLAASSPELVRTMNTLAHDRIGGLQKLAAEPHNAQVTLLGNRWDSACLDLRRFLERNQISFNWLTLDDPNLADHWPGPPPLDCPVLRLVDGTTLI